MRGLFVTLLVAVLAAAPAFAARTGEPAPAFVLATAAGDTVDLARQMIHQLGEHQFAAVRAALPAKEHTELRISRFKSETSSGKRIKGLQGKPGQ